MSGVALSCRDRAPLEAAEWIRQVLPTALNHASAASPIMTPRSSSSRDWLGLIAFRVIMTRPSPASSISTHVAPAGVAVDLQCAPSTVFTRWSGERRGDSLTEHAG
jgi:hypothetical protein